MFEVKIVRGGGGALKTLVLAVCALLLLVATINVFCSLYQSNTAYADNYSQNINTWYDSNQKPFSVFDDFYDPDQVPNDISNEYNDGTLSVTSRVVGSVNAKTGVVSFTDQIVLTNLTSDKEISFNSVSAKLNPGFESADIKNWDIKNSESILFSGTAGTQYTPDLVLDSNESKTFNVSTGLTGLKAGSLANKTPFNFVYDYEAEKSGYIATIDTTDGFVKSGAPIGWTKESDTRYTKKFPEGTDYFTILAEWDSTLFEHSTDPESYSFWGFSPLSGILTTDTTFLAQWSAYFYKVCIWGINEDTYDEDSTHLNGLTFGPAIGESNACLEVDGHHEHCIHNDSWEIIIANCKAGHADWYNDCLNEGCTKAITINMNTSLGTKAANKIECSVLSNCIYDDYKKWNYSSDSSDFESTDYATCRIRATLNGKNGNESTYAGPDWYFLDSSNCVLSCFPKVLQDNIKPKYMEVATTWEKSYSSSYKILTSTVIADKLWLMNANEIYGNPSAEYKDYRNQYSKALNMGITRSAYSNNIVFNELGSSYYRWLRSTYRANLKYGVYATPGGKYFANGVTYSAPGISPCFCL